MRPKEPYQLLLVRELHDDGLRLLRQDTPYARLRGIITEDAAVELLLNTIIHDGEDTLPSPLSLEKLLRWDQVWSAAVTVARANGLASGLPGYRQLQRLHEVRNLAHHNGTIPDTSEANRYIEAVTTLLARAFQSLYGLRHDCFTRWELLANEQLRTLLSDASQAVEDGHPWLAKCAVIIAHRLLTVALSTYLFGTESQEPPFCAADVDLLSGRFADRQGSLKSVLGGLGGKVASAMEIVRDHIATTSLGIPLRDRKRFIAAAAGLSVQVALGGKVYISHTTDLKSVDAASMEWCLDYLFRYSLRAQDVFPEAMDAIKVPTRLAEQGFWRQEYAVAPEQPGGAGRR